MNYINLDYCKHFTKEAKPTNCRRNPNVDQRYRNCEVFYGNKFRNTSRMLSIYDLLPFEYKGSSI